MVCGLFADDISAFGASTDCAIFSRRRPHIRIHDRAGDHHPAATYWCLPLRSALGKRACLSLRGNWKHLPGLSSADGVSVGTDQHDVCVSDAPELAAFL